jgi:hypothetical protein
MKVLKALAAYQDASGTHERPGGLAVQLDAPGNQDLIPDHHVDSALTSGSPLMRLPQFICLDWFHPSCRLFS